MWIQDDSPGAVGSLADVCQDQEMTAFIEGFAEAKARRHCVPGVGTDKAQLYFSQPLSHPQLPSPRAVEG